jgi:hypothetical protein
MTKKKTTKKIAKKANKKKSSKSVVKKVKKKQLIKSKNPVIKKREAKKALKKPKVKKEIKGKAVILLDDVQAVSEFIEKSDIVVEEVVLTASVETDRAKKKISRKKPGTKSIEYFDQYTQQAIVAYQQELVVNEKNKIYLEEIYPAFDSLVENLINVYGFNVMYDSKQDLKNECLEFLYGTLPKFNAEKGSKAFSYFNVVAKNWLTIKSKQNSKRLQSYISIDNKENISQQDLEAIEGYSIAPDGEELMITAELRTRITRLIEEVGNKAKTDNEQNCVRAIKILLENIDDVDFLNKRAVLLYLREITGFSSKQLSIVLASIKKHYKEAKTLEEFN